MSSSTMNKKEATAKKDEFGKDFFKLMNNSCYGQMMMNERDFKHGEFCSATKMKKTKRGKKVSETKTRYLRSKIS